MNKDHERLPPQKNLVEKAFASLKEIDKSYKSHLAGSQKWCGWVRIAGKAGIFCENDNGRH